jgi:hypothetical protein
MDRIGPGPACRLDQGVDAQVRLGGGVSTQGHAFVGLPDKWFRPIGVGEHRHSFYAHGPAGPEDPPGDFPAISHQEFADHRGRG